MSRLRLAALALLVGCERDPSLIGYWDIPAMRAGASADALAEVTLAGSIEFHDNGDGYAMFAYFWDGTAWAPDPRPDLLVLTTDVRERDDFVETYKEKDETYAVTMSAPGDAAPIVFAVEEWKGSTVTLASEDALPPGLWGTGAGGGRGIFEMDLEW